jgi:hypothetical protein
MTLSITLVLLLWVEVAYPQSRVETELACYQSRQNRTQTKTLSNGFVVVVSPGSDDAEQACRIRVRDKTGRVVFTGEGFNTRLHPDSGRDIDNDGKPDAIVGVDTGGGNRCCWEYTIISFSPSPHVVAKLPPIAFDFTSDREGKTLIRETEAFYDLGNSMADSPTVTIVRQFRSGQLMDVTSDYCKSILSEPADNEMSLVLQNLYCREFNEASRLIRDKWPTSEQAAVRARIKKEMEARWPEIARLMTDW